LLPDGFLTSPGASLLSPAFARWSGGCGL